MNAVTAFKFGPFNTLVSKGNTKKFKEDLSSPTKLDMNAKFAENSDVVHCIGGNKAVQNLKLSFITETSYQFCL